MARIITIANQKGGCAKTTTAANLAFSLSRLGNKVLVVDFDSQANLTTCYGVDNPKELEVTIADLMNLSIEDKELPAPDSYILEHNGVDFIPSSIALSAVDMKLQQTAIFAEKTLSDILDTIKDNYDYIIIDTCPSLGNLTINALTAANEVIITVNPQLLAMMGLQDLLGTIKKIKKRINPELTVSGILLTMCDKRTNLYKAIVSEVKEACGDNINVFDSQIPFTTKVGESIYYGLSIAEYKPNSTAGQAYMDLAKEIIEQGE